jgi:hypothetical protein
MWTVYRCLELVLQVGVNNMSAYNIVLPNCFKKSLKIPKGQSESKNQIKQLISTLIEV